MTDVEVDIAKTRLIEEIADLTDALDEVLPRADRVLGLASVFAGEQPSEFNLQTRALLQRHVTDLHRITDELGNWDLYP